MDNFYEMKVAITSIVNLCKLSGEQKNLLLKFYTTHYYIVVGFFFNVYGNTRVYLSPRYICV